VPGICGPIIGNLSADPDVGVLALEGRAHCAHQIADAKDSPLRLKAKSELLEAGHRRGSLIHHGGTEHTQEAQAESCCRPSVLRVAVLKRLSSYKSIHQPSDETQHNAENDAGGDREEHGSVLPSIADVARQASDGNIRSSGEKNDCANQDQQAAGANQEFA
jgi:hypothetical protein